MIQTYETIHLETDARGIARLVLNRPDKHNALNAAMIREITDAATRLANDNSVRAVVLSASGRSFCAGGDLAWMKQQFDADHTTRVLEASHLAAMLRCLDELPKLLIAVIEGSAFGGGVGLAAVCDIVLAAPDTKFALTETKLGLIPATIAPVLLRRIGLANIRARLSALYGGAASMVLSQNKLAGVTARVEITKRAVPQWIGGRRKAA